MCLAANEGIFSVRTLAVYAQQSNIPTVRQARVYPAFTNHSLPVYMQFVFSGLHSLPQRFFFLI